MNEDDDARDQHVEAAWKGALRREVAPEGFAERVEARLRHQPTVKGRKPGRTSLPYFPAQVLTHASVRLAVAAALMLMIVLPLGYRLHRQAEIAKGEAARQQVMLALRIAGTQLRSIQGRTQSIHIEPGILEGESQ